MVLDSTVWNVSVSGALNMETKKTTQQGRGCVVFIYTLFLLFEANHSWSLPEEAGGKGPSL